MTNEEALREAAYQEALEQGRTCMGSCKHRQGDETPWCTWNRPSFPARKCRDYRCKPGSDE